MRHIRLLIFELDYLIFDGAAAKLRALRQGLGRLAEDLQDEAPLPDNGDIETAFVDYGSRWIDGMEIPLSDDRRMRLAEEVRNRLTREIESSGGRIYPRIPELLRWCRDQGLILALGADATRSYALGVSDRYHLEDFFDFVACSEEYGAAGIEELLEDLMERAEVHPSECIYLGTRDKALETAKALGLATLGCRWGLPDRIGFRDVDRSADRVTEVPDAVGQLDEVISSADL